MKSKNKDAFTLLEAMIVMGITVLVFAFGIVGVVNVRRSIELKNGYNDLISNIKLSQNKARNSVREEGQPLPKYYALSFSNLNYSSELCNESLTTQGQIDCNIDEESLKPERYSILDITSTCTKIGFQRLSSNIVKIDGTVASDTGTCTISVKHRDTQKKFDINLNFETNTISYD